MTKKEQQLLERLLKLLEAQSSREWTDLLAEAEVQLSVLTVSQFRRSLKRALAREKRLQLRAARPKTKPESKMKSSPEFGRYIEVQDLRSHSKIPEGREFSSWLRLIGREVAQKQLFPNELGNQPKPPKGKVP